MFYQQRPEPNILKSFIQKYDSLYAVFPMGDAVKIYNRYDPERVQHVILFDPYGNHIDTIPDKYYVNDTGAIKETILTVTKHILAVSKGKIDVRWWDGCLPFSMWIGNPKSGNGAILLEQHVPYAEGSDRPTIIFEQTAYPELFKALKDSFECLSGKARRAEVNEGTITKQ